MDEIPDTVTAGAVELDRIESPPEIACWRGTFGAADGEVGASLIIEPAAGPTPESTATLAAIPERFAELDAAAKDLLRERLQDSRYELTADELTRLADEAPFSEPEVVVWGDGTWMLRYAEVPFGFADPYGVGVNFVAEAPQGVEDLSEPDEA